MPLELEAQRAHKTAPLRKFDVPIRWHASEHIGYRRRIRLRVDERGKVAFFNPSKPIDCAVLSPSLRIAMDRLRDGVSLPGVEHVEVRASDLDGRAGLFAPGGAHDQLREALGDFRIATRRGTPVWQRWALLDGRWSYVPVDAFLQVHAGANELLLRAMVDGASARRTETFFDAYSGAGNLALTLAAMGMRGVASDTHAGAIAALEASARSQGLDVVARVGDAATIAAGAPSLVVANPPRAGLRAAASHLATMGAPHIALITCTFDALVADTARLQTRGYRLTELHAIEMFPHTEHLEVLAWFSASES